MSQHFTSGGQSIGISASTSVLPMNTQDWSPLGWTGWISLQSKELSRVFSNTTVQTHQFLAYKSGKDREGLKWSFSISISSKSTFSEKDCKGRSLGGWGKIYLQSGLNQYGMKIFFFSFMLLFLRDWNNTVIISTLNKLKAFYKLKASNGKKK